MSTEHIIGELKITAPITTEVVAYGLDCTINHYGGEVTLTGQCHNVEINSPNLKISTFINSRWRNVELINGGDTTHTFENCIIDGAITTNMPEKVVLRNTTVGGGIIQKNYD